MRMVVTGATGNVGTALLRRLDQEPDVEVVGLARRLPTGGAAPYDRADWVRCDLSEPASTLVLRRVLRGADALVHLAWLLQPSHRPELLAAVNVAGSRRVFEAAADAGVERIAYLSSLGAYAPGPVDARVGEDHPTTGVPASWYSRHKVAVERLLDRMEAAGELTPAVRFRPPVVFQRDAGAEVTRYFLGPFVPIRLLRRVRLPLMPDHPRLRFQVVHADDVADAVVRAVRRGFTGPVNLAADPVLSLRDVAWVLGGRPVRVPVGLLAGTADLTWRLRLQPVDAGWLHLAAAAPLMDTSRARTGLGWVPAHDGREVLREQLAGMIAGCGAGGPLLRPRDHSLRHAVDALVHLRLPGTAAFN